MRITLSTSRFNATPMHAFLKKVHEIAQKARMKTETEKRIARVRWSMENDVSLSGPRPHSDDVLSIALRESAKLEAFKAKELRALELETLREETEAIRVLLLAKEARINELDSERGSSIFHQRQAEIRAAQAKSA